MSRLIEYFNEVDKNAVMRAAHLAEPTAAMQKFGLSASEQDAVISGEALSLAKAAGILPRESSQLQVVHVPNTNIIYQVDGDMGGVSKFQAIHIPQEIYLDRDL